MVKWILTLVVAIFLLGVLTPHLARFIRFGQLPGDFESDAFVRAGDECDALGVHAESPFRENATPALYEQSFSLRIRFWLPPLHAR